MAGNGLMMQYFEWYLDDDGQLWNRLKEDAKHLKELGVTAVWTPPAYKATGTNDAGYGVYDLYDLGEFDQKGAVRTKYGTKAEYLAAIEALHAEGIAVYADVVLNHKAGADETERFRAYEVNPENRQEKRTDSYEIEGWTKFTFPGRGDKYSDFKWSWEHFTGTDFNNENGRKAIYMFKGFEKGWAEDESVDNEHGNYDYLMYTDIDYSHPAVVEEIKKWADWYIKETGVDGFRLDAIKHMNDHFVQDLVETIRAQHGDDFYVVGEYWKYRYGTMREYLEATDFTFDLFDVALHQNFHVASQQGKEYDLAESVRAVTGRQKSDPCGYVCRQPRFAAKSSVAVLCRALVHSVGIRRHPVARTRLPLPVLRRLLRHQRPASGRRPTSVPWINCSICAPTMLTANNVTTSTTATASAGPVWAMKSIRTVWRQSFPTVKKDSRICM